MTQLSISDVRRELIRASGIAVGAVPRSNAACGTIFHEVLAGLTGPEGWRRALEPNELGDERRLAAHAYDKFLGPRLTERQANLRECGAEAMDLWLGVQAACEWICRILAAAEKTEAIRYNAGFRAWTGADKLCQPEKALAWEVAEPGWTAPVRVTGVADAVWKNPETGRWCVLEYKIGKARLEADLAQACLYHSALVASGLSNGDGSLAVIHFEPEANERFYASAELAEALPALRRLIGRMAGVSQEGPERPPPPSGDVLGRNIVKVLKQFGIAVEWTGEVISGPSIRRYFFIPGRQTRLRQVRDRAEDLGMQLLLKSTPLVQNSEGRLTIDIARPDPEIVKFESLMDQLSGPDPGGCSRVPLGIDLNGRLRFVDLASPNNPHLLVAGTAGSGKSEWLRSAIAGLIVSNTPQTLRLVLIDPKRTAFGELKGSRYLYHPQALVYPPEQSPSDVLDSLIEEMERRYELFEKQLASDLPGYRAKTGIVLPRIVCVCDEYADLLVDRAATKSLAAAVGRLGAKARAAGIHLVIATQHPDRRTVEGALKMNLGGRVCFRVANHHQSNMIINQSGAERLLGLGDLLFLSVGDPVRLQAPLLSDELRAKIFV